MPPSTSLMLRAVLVLAVLGAIAGTWYWLGRPLSLPPSPLGQTEKLGCVSYTPFHGDQSPFMEGLVISDAQIAEDMERLAEMTSCVRTYSAAKEHGRIAPIAGAHGLKVLQGIWLGRELADNEVEIESALALARDNPGVIEALIVGNETLLRGELSVQQLKDYMTRVKEQSALPVTYADVWEFWLKAPELAEVADFITIHILPYWEDHPVAAADAVAHVRDVRQHVAKRFPGKEIFIGEVGWPSDGRMREGALPSRINQARVLSGVVAATREEGWRANVIEAFDQPWKRKLEGKVGAHWGIFDDTNREPKFRFGESVSNHPDWATKAALGIGAALLVFGAGRLGERHRTPNWRRDLATALIALAAGLTVGTAAVEFAAQNMFLADRVRLGVMLFLAAVVPAAAAFALARGHGLSAFADATTAWGWRNRSRTTAGLALLLVLTVVVALHVALGLVFDPRYNNFPFAALTGPVIGLAVLSSLRPGQGWKQGAAETACAAVLGFSAIFIVINEGLLNWQALWIAALLALLALATLKAQDARG